MNELDLEYDEIFSGLYLYLVLMGGYYCSDILSMSDPV